MTRLDPSGQCVFGASVAVPNLTAALDPTGQVVLSGLVDAAPVDGCGSLVVASNDYWDFDAGYGKLPPPPPSPWPWYAAVVRFAP